MNLKVSAQDVLNHRLTGVTNMEGMFVVQWRCEPVEHL